MDIAHQIHAVRFQHAYQDRNTVERVIAWTANAANASIYTYEDVQGTANVSDDRIHQALLSPWILGVVLQSILMGIIVSQVHNLYLRRSHLSLKTAATTTLLFCTNGASFGTQTSTLWYFSMSSLGDVHYLITSCRSKREYLTEGPVLRYSPTVSPNESSNRYMVDASHGGNLQLCTDLVCLSGAS